MVKLLLPFDTSQQNNITTRLPLLKGLRIGGQVQQFINTELFHLHSSNFAR
jgi:hypothetical protein